MWTTPWTGAACWRRSSSAWIAGAARPMTRATARQCRAASASTAICRISLLACAPSFPRPATAPPASDEAAISFFFFSVDGHYMDTVTKVKLKARITVHDTGEATACRIKGLITEF
ncbi:hypothetical protein Cni_G26817 [Canna indica]|uniref:Uncharacterized protein n=1 Tax=Canna indica TaxID=4628 RepID=A0AAQ3L0J0_9LILI|nr:hypothetical protein Cni_G26817 [Canna indica]